MTLHAQLTALEAAGLIDLREQDEEIFLSFRHTLFQEAAYQSLLKNERQRLHRVVGETLEQVFAGRWDEVAAILAGHFGQAGLGEKALRYYLLAGDQAALRYANAEANTCYTQALGLARDDRTVQAEILRKRASISEIRGDFESACSDLENALATAEQAGDQAGAWQALIGLGMLWSSRDYRKTGRYYEQALSLARKIGDPAILAHSLRWQGNYDTNLENATDAQRYLLEALELFEGLEDQTGIAETNDLLGMTSSLGGNLFSGKVYLEEAIRRFELLGDRRGLSSSLASLALMTSEFQTDIMPTPRFPVDEGIQMANRSLEIASQLGWKAGQSYAWFCLSLCLVSAGEYQKALEASTRSLAIAQEIGHRQWEIAGRFAFAVCLVEVDDYKAAADTLRPALDLALEINSSHWIHAVTGLAASAWMELGDLKAADDLLSRYLPEDEPSKTIGQRMAWVSRIAMALKRDNPERALEIIQAMIDGSYQDHPGQVIIRLWMLKALAMYRAAARQKGSAERQALLGQASVLAQEALDEATALGYRSRIWQIQRIQAAIAAGMGDQDQAHRARAEWQAQVIELAASLEDPERRKRFIHHALEG